MRANVGEQDVISIVNVAKSLERQKEFNQEHASLLRESAILRLTQELKVQLEHHKRNANNLRELQATQMVQSHRAQENAKSQLEAIKIPGAS
jgi:hypothetical protein